MGQKLRIASGLTIPLSELHFRFSRSGGAGGQNVNKVSTRVELVFDVWNSPSLTAAQKDRITDRAKSRISTDGALTISSQESRSQWQNREHVVQKFVALLTQSLKERRPRIATRATKPSKERRLSAKTLTSRKKKSRQRPDLE